MTAIRALPMILAIAAVLVLAGPAAGQQPPSPPAAGQPAAGGIDKAQSLIRERRFVEALSVLQPLAKRRPIPANVLFLIGFAAIEASQQPGGAVAACEAALLAVWPAYRKGLDATEYEREISIEHLMRARANLPELDAFLGEIGWS